jgi:hypothetical protein
MKIKFIIAVSLLFISCKSGKKEYRFLLNDTFVIKQTSINELAKKYPIRFSQYEGFSFRSKDSTVGTVYLSIPEQEEIESDVVDSMRINQFRKSKVDKVTLYYTFTPKEKADIKGILKKRFPGLRISEDVDSDDILIMDDRRRLVCTVSYSNTFSGNYTFEYNPIAFTTVNL